jgi:hypothetical protein
MCLNVQTGANPIVVDNMQTNPGLFRDIKTTQNWNLFTNDASLASHFQNNIAPKASESQDLYPSGTAVNILGDGAITFYSNFYNNPFRGFVINGSPTMKSYLSGGEGEQFYLVESEGNGPIDLEIIANTYHPIESDPAITGFGSFQLKPNSSGSIKILNTTSFSAPNTGYRINNGSLIIQSAFQTVQLQTWVEARGDASVSVEGNYLRNGLSVFHGVEYSDSADVDILGTYSSNNYRVSTSVDVSGSSPLYVTRVDVIPPSKPHNLIGDPFSSAQIDLSWEPSTDNIGVTGYYVYRDGIRIGEANDTAYSDTGLDPETLYEYFVRAVDDAKNLSVASDTISVSTLPVWVENLNNSRGGLTIFPNPAKGKLFVSVPGTNDPEFHFKLYSVNGALLLSEELHATGKETEYGFDVSNLEEGLYIYQVVNSTRTYMGKLYISK